MVCNPYCGRCRPPQPRSVVCPECKRYVIAVRGEPWACPVCHTPLPKRETLRCNWTGMLCDVPCYRNIRENPDGAMHRCPWTAAKEEDRRVQSMFERGLWDWEREGDGVMNRGSAANPPAPPLPSEPGAA